MNQADYEHRLTHLRSDSYLIDISIAHAISVIGQCLMALERMVNNQAFPPFNISRTIRFPQIDRQAKSTSLD